MKPGAAKATADWLKKADDQGIKRYNIALPSVFQKGKLLLDSSVPWEADLGKESVHCLNQV